MADIGHGKEVDQAYGKLFEASERAQAMVGMLIDWDFANNDYPELTWTKIHAALELNKDVYQQFENASYGMFETLTDELETQKKRYQELEVMYLAAKAQ